MKSTLTTEELSNFFAELYLLKQAGISEQEALEIMSDGQNTEGLQKFLTTLISHPDLPSGLAQYPDVIPKYIIELLHLAEKNNTETQVLATLAEHLADSSLTDQNGLSYRQKLINCLLYPLVVLLICSMIGGFIYIFVLPAFEEMFLGFGAELPALTNLFIGMVHYAEPVVGLLLISTLVITIYLNTPYSKELKFKLLLKIPLINEITCNIESAAIIKTLHLLCNSGFDLPVALALTAGASKNPLYIAALTTAAQEVAQGKKLADSLKPMQLFSARTLRLLAVFENTLKLSLLNHLAHSYHKPIHKQITFFIRLVNITLLIVCWLLVAFTVIALYLPLFAMGATI